MTRCQYCSRHVQWLKTRFGQRMLFNATPIPKAQADPGKAWMPGRWRLGGQEKIALAPLRHYSRGRVDAATHVVTLHSCEEYAQAVAAAGLSSPTA